MQALTPNIFKVYRDKGSTGWGYSYLVTHNEGNLFFARMAKTTQITHQYDAIRALGGIKHIYITDFHFAGDHVVNVAETFGASVHCSAAEEPRIRKAIPNVIAFEYVQHVIKPPVEVIPTPGHTAGGVCYRVTLDRKQYLFSGDFLYFDGKEWIVGARQYKAVKDSLDRVEALDFDVLVGCGDDALGIPWIDLSDASTKRDFFNSIRQRFLVTP